MDNFFTTADAAVIAGLKPVSVRMAILRGTLPARKAGRDWLIAKADLEAFVQSDRKRGRRPEEPHG